MGKTGITKEFKEFIARGNVLDMAVGIVVGTSFGAIAQSLASDVLMPPIGVILGNVDFSNLFVVLKAGDPAPPYATLADAQAAGAVTLNYGAFANTVVSFLIIAVAVFLVVRTANRLRRQAPPEPTTATEKPCPYCTMSIPIGATRCPHCTSALQETVAG